MDQLDTTNLYIYGCRAYSIRNEVLVGNQDKVVNKTRPRTYIGYLVRYSSSNIYRIQVLQNGEVLKVRDVKFEEKEIFNFKDELIREYRLRVYKIDLDGVEPILDTYYY